ncbi:putative membrane protein, partial [Trabulsiella guamensis ATCC 49490]
MFKSFNTGWLKLALLTVWQSGWTIIVLVGLSLLFCNVHGRPAF